MCFITQFSHTFCLEALILLLRGWMCKFCGRIMGRKLDIVGSIWVKHPQLLIPAPCLSLPRKREGRRKQLVFYFSSPPRLRSISCYPCIANPPELRIVSKAFFACGPLWFVNSEQAVYSAALPPSLVVCCFLYFPFSLLVSRFSITNPPLRIVSNDIFACSPLWFVKRKCYIWKLLIVAGKAMCHTYDSHLVEYINLLCGRNGAQLFTKLLQCSRDICWKSNGWMWLEIGASDNDIRHFFHWILSCSLNRKRIM